MANATNIIQLIAGPSAKPETSFEVSHLERGDSDRFDRFLQNQADAPRNNHPQPSPQPSNSVEESSRPPAGGQDSRPGFQADETGPAGQQEPAPTNLSKAQPHGNSVVENKPQASPGNPSAPSPVNPFALPLENFSESTLTGLPQTGEVTGNVLPDLEILADSLDPESLPAGHELGHHLDTFRQFLEGLNIDPEIIDQLIDTASNGALPGLQGIINALRGLLQAANNVAAAPVAENIPPVAAAHLTNLPEQKALNILVQAGLTEEEALQVIEQVRTAGPARPSADSTAPILKTGTEGAPVKINSENNFSAGSNAQGNGQAEGQKNTGGTPGEGNRNAAGLSRENLDNLAALLASDRSSQNSNGQHVNPLTQKPVASTLLNAHTPAPQPVQAGLAEGTPGQAPAPAEAAARAVDFVKPALTETYTGRASMEKPITAQIVEKFTLRGFANQREVHIKLDPPSLGTVRMNVSTSGETVRATIIAENHIVKSVIENSLPQLRDSINSQGVKVDSFNVLVGGQADSHSAHQRQEALDGPGIPGAAFSDVPEDLEEMMTFHRSVYMYENQSISVFA